MHIVCVMCCFYQVYYDENNCYSFCFSFLGLVSTRKTSKCHSQYFPLSLKLVLVPVYHVESCIFLFKGKTLSCRHLADESIGVVNGGP